MMLRCAPGAVGWRGGDAAVCKAGLTDITLARLGGAFEVLWKQARKTNKNNV